MHAAVITEADLAVGNRRAVFRSLAGGALALSDFPRALVRWSSTLTLLALPDVHHHILASASQLTVRA